MKTEESTLDIKKNTLDNITVSDFDAELIAIERGISLPMKIFKVSLTHGGWDTYISAVICAENREKLRSFLDKYLTFKNDDERYEFISNSPMRDQIQGEVFSINNGQEISDIEYLGDAAPGCVEFGKTIRVVETNFMRG